MTSTTTTAPMTETNNKRLHIKSLTISGFRSYSESKVTSLSSRHNCIVGPNGSGKSNFFAALEFILGEREFSNLSHEERQELLHEGGKQDPVLTAYVEVTFDNTEGRLPLDTEEVVLRRSVGLKKDEFFLNRKHVSKTDISNLLESAGFSKSNPYYICRQGKVSELCTMKDSQRLSLLKEVAGTTVYDSRKKDSETLLEEAKQKTIKIDESILNITNKLKELEEEKKELEQFRHLDKERRALDYLLSDYEMISSEKKLEELEKSRIDLTIEAQERIEELDKISQQAETYESNASFSQQELSRLESKRKNIETKLSSISKSRAKRELDVRDLEERVRARTEKLVTNKNELAKVEEEIAKAEEQLDGREDDGLKPRLEKAKIALNKCRESIKRLEQKEAELRSKQGRTARFGTDKKKRNEWIDEEIDGLKAAIESKNQSFKEYENRLNALNEDKSKFESQLNGIEKEMEENSDGFTRSNAAIDKIRENLKGSSERRKEFWKMKSTQEDELRKGQEELKLAEKTLNEICPMAFSLGMKALDEICTLKKVDKTKVYGSLLSLIQCEDVRFRTAVEVAAAGQLLHVVVENDSIAAELMEGLKEKRAGRLTFKPLNVLVQREKLALQSRNKGVQELDDEDDDEGGGSGIGGDLKNLQEKISNDPEINKDEAIPLINLVRYDDKFAPAVRAMLGNTLACRNHRIASYCSKKFGVNCVTLDGDQVTRRGALSGGFIDSKRNRLTASEEILKSKEKLNQIQKKFETAEGQSVKEEQEHTRLSGELDKFETTRKQLNSQKQNLIQEKTRITRSLKTVMEGLETLLENAISQPTELHEQIEQLEKEKKQPVLSALKEEEKEELISIPKQLAELKTEEQKLSEEESELRSKVVLIKTELEENLLRRRDELITSLEHASSSSGGSASQDNDGNGGLSIQEMNLETAKSELETIRKEETETKVELENLDSNLEKAREEYDSLSKKLDRLKEKELKASEEKDKAEDEVEKLLDQRDIHVKNREKAARKIREVGALPSDELDKFRHLSTKDLGNKLQKVNTELKKFAGVVNKKALEQFVSFSEQKQQLVTRQNEAQEADKKIRDLIKHLDRAKDEAILLTFKHVAHNFREIFSELIPGGIAELRMVKGGKDDDDDDEENVEEEDEPQVGKVSSFIGVSPRVSFSGSKETVPMKQLSGGQKALVALTLIFAIQRCDPAPFYLFDEIDQALDSTHRTAVAALIQRQTKSKSRSAQFITTTFRPELVLVADKCFGIQFSHKVSTVGMIDKEQALKFIRDALPSSKQQQQQETKVSPLKQRQEEEEDEEEDDDDEEEEKMSSPSKKKKKKNEKDEVASFNDSPVKKPKKLRKSTESKRKREEEEEEEDS